ncbi:hypothetical protein ACLOJK_015058 [Asimina triloba]
MQISLKPLLQEAFTANSRRRTEEDCNCSSCCKLSSSGTVCRKTSSQLQVTLSFSSQRWHLRRSDILLPPGKQKLGTHLSFNARREASPHNAVTARPIDAVNEPSPKDQALSNSPNPPGGSFNSPVTRAEIHALMEMMKFLKKQMVCTWPDTTSIPTTASAGVPSPLATTPLTPDMVPTAHHL